MESKILDKGEHFLQKTMAENENDFITVDLLKVVLS